MWKKQPNKRYSGESISPAVSIMLKDIDNSLAGRLTPLANRNVSESLQDNIRYNY